MALETAKKSILRRLTFANEFNYLPEVDFQGTHNRRKKIEAKPKAWYSRFADEIATLTKLPLRSPHKKKIKESKEKYFLYLKHTFFGRYPVSTTSNVFCRN